MAETSPRPREEGQLLALRFGVFELDVRSGELRRNGSIVRLQPQPFKVLLLLASKPGEVVTREEIQAELWPSGTYVDFEQSLNFCVRQIRAALGDSAVTPRFVETLPRRGYRWVGGAVEPVTAGATVHEWPKAVPALEEAGAGPEGRARARWIPAAVVGVVAVLLGSLGTWLSLRRPGEPAPPSFQRMTFRRGFVSSGHFAPDGQVAFTAAWDGREPILYVTRSDPRDFRPLDIVGARIVGVSASGEVAFVKQGVLARAPLAGGPRKEVLKGVIAADWLPDGSDFAVARRTEGKVRIEFPIGRVLAETARVGRLVLSPDGRRLAYTEHPMLDDDRGRVVVMDRDGREILRTEDWASLDGLAWSADGREVWFTASSVGADNELRAVRLDGRVRTILSGMGRLVLHDIAPDGRVLLERTTLRLEMLFRRAGEAEDRDLSWLDFSAAVGITADGGSLFFYESGQGGGPDYTTYVRMTDGSLPVRVGPGRALDISPDGQWVLSVSLHAPSHLDLVPTGAGEARKLEVPGAAVHEAGGFLPGGREVFASVRDAAGKRSTWLLDLAGGAPRRLPLPEGHILMTDTFSPDGRHFVASCSDDRSCIYDTAGGEPRPIPGAKERWSAVAWDARGRIYFRAMGDRWGGPEELLRLDPRTGRTQRVATLAPRDGSGALGVLGVLVAADGESWAYNVMRRLSDLYVATDLD